MPKKTGRPPLNIDPKQVESMAALGCTQAEIAAVLGGSRQTIGGRFRHEYEKGREKLKTSLRMKQREVALAGNVTMLIWLGKQYLGQSDKTEVTGATETAIRFVMGTDAENQKTNNQTTD